MSTPRSSRIESIDVLRGVVMIIMALDHARDYFYYDSFAGDPTDLSSTTSFLFFTRFITHYCAPVFVFLAGTSAFLYGAKKGKKTLTRFLFTRGLWLIFLEITLNDIVWTFDPTHSLVILQVIWAIGICMVLMAGLIHLPFKAILGLGLAIIAGHNILDLWSASGQAPGDVFWYFLHQRSRILFSSGRMLSIAYPFLPWVGVMMTGYCLGALYQKGFDAQKRRRWLRRMGWGAIALFFLVRGINLYGDLVPWAVQDSAELTVLSFFNVTKYPPSLAYVLITLGPSLLFLAAVEGIQNRVTNFFLIFGRVPLFYYFAHIFVLHALAVFLLWITGQDPSQMILTTQTFQDGELVGYGYPLYVAYFFWLLVVLLLYLPSKRYMAYKANNRDKWWLSYL